MESSRQGIKPVFPALAGGFFTTEPPGKSTGSYFRFRIQVIPCGICLGVSDLVHLVWSRLVVSMLLQMAFIHCFFMAEYCVYVPHLLYPFICRWTFRLFACFGYYEQCCFGHRGTSWIALYRLFLALFSFNMLSLVFFCMLWFWAAFYSLLFCASVVNFYLTCSQFSLPSLVWLLTEWLN